MRFPYRVLDLVYVRLFPKWNTKSNQKCEGARAQSTWVDTLDSGAAHRSRGSYGRELAELLNAVAIATAPLIRLRRANFQFAELSISDYLHETVLREG